MAVSVSPITCTVVSRHPYLAVPNSTARLSPSRPGQLDCDLVNSVATWLTRSRFGQLGSRCRQSESQSRPGSSLRRRLRTNRRSLNELLLSLRESLLEGSAQRAYCLVDQALLRSVNHLLDHVAADLTCLVGAEVSVVLGSD